MFNTIVIETEIVDIDALGAIVDSRPVVVVIDEIVDGPDPVDDDPDNDYFPFAV